MWVGDLTQYLRHALEWRVGVLLSTWRWVRRRPVSSGQFQSVMRDLAQLWLHGGWDYSVLLTPRADGTQRGVRLVVQPDGDVLLYLPPDFGAQSNDTQGMAEFMSVSNQKLAAMRHCLPANWPGLASLGIETVFLGGGASSAWNAVVAGVAAPEVLWPLARLVGSVLLPVLGSYCGAWIARILARVVRNRLHTYAQHFANE